VFHAIAVDSRRAFKQPPWIGHVSGAAFVDENLDVRMIAHDGSGRASVIEVNVSQEDVSDVGPTDTICLQSQFERGQTRCRSWIHNRHTGSTLHQAGGDHLGPAMELEIDPRQSLTQYVHSATS
jgi:hypothetical protein